MVLLGGTANKPTKDNLEMVNRKRDKNNKKLIISTARIYDLDTAIDL